jgi:transcription termination factor NusA
MSTSDETPRDLFVRALAIDKSWADVLVENGFTTLEEVAYVPIDEFRSIEGFSEEQIQTWRARARTHLLAQAIDSEGDGGDPLPIPVVDPPKPLSGGAGARMDDDDAGSG